MTETAAPIAKASPTPATTTNKSRPSASTTTSIEKDTAWLRFQADTGVQAAYTDPINPLFDAISPQPLYSFAAGYTHVFSQNLVNYFNPAFSWYESLFGPTDFQKTLAAFPIVLQGSGANAPSPPSADSTTPGFRAGAPPASSSTTTWLGAAAPTNCASEPTPASSASTITTSAKAPSPPSPTPPCRNSFTESHRPPRKTFPTTANEPFNFLNLDLYAQDTWKLTPETDLDLRPARHAEFQSTQSASTRSPVFPAPSLPSRTTSTSR